jgi:hypothetical protein
LETTTGTTGVAFFALFVAFLGNGRIRHGKAAKRAGELAFDHVEGRGDALTEDVLFVGDGRS